MIEAVLASEFRYGMAEVVLGYKTCASVFLTA
jgi:hypothetical protein